MDNLSEFYSQNAGTIKKKDKINLYFDIFLVAKLLYKY